MLFETIKTPGLAHLSYILGDDSAGTAVVIDPRRDIEVYLESTRKAGVRIDRIIETHVHADLVSGGPMLAKQTGAELITGPAESLGYAHRVACDEETFEVGKLTLQVLYTPGHTPEHISLVVSGGKGAKEPWGVFTGDTLFSGEVGRPDLLGKDYVKKLVKQLHEALHKRLLALPDGVIVFPGHGQGSPCGGSIGDRDTTTIGYERKNNPSLQDQEEESFARTVLEGAAAQPAPGYYKRMKQMNAEGAMGEMAELRPLLPKEVQRLAEEDDVLLLDARPIEAFGGAHIARALNIALQDEFPIWCGWMVPADRRVVLVLSDDSDLKEAQSHLYRIGIDRIEGYLAQGMSAWFAAGLPFRRLDQISVHDLHDRLHEFQILDVRREDEWNEGHVPTAMHRFVPEIPSLDGQLDRSRPTVTYCESGFRANIAASLLQQLGYAHVYSIPGSMGAWRAAGYETE